MADDKGPVDNGLGTLKGFFLILGALFVLWVISGGYNRASKDDKFVQENEGLQIGETYDQPVTIFGETF